MYANFKVIVLIALIISALFAWGDDRNNNE
jgi:hypothetical protein